jgi:hypothetical protein
MPVTASQTRCNANALRKFGALVQLGGVPVWGDFSAATHEHEAAGMLVSASDPTCAVLDADVPANPVGRPFITQDGEAFTVRDLRSDDFGMTVLILQKGA